MKKALFGFDAFGPIPFLEGGDWTDDELREVGEKSYEDWKKIEGGEDEQR